MPKHLRPSNSTLLLEVAHELRAKSTDAESELWFHLRAHRLDGLKFRRQHPIPPYVLDFYCDAAKLAASPVLFPDDATRRRLFFWSGTTPDEERTLQARFSKISAL